MDKISHIPKLSGKENYREWALEIKGLAQWGNFLLHYESTSIASGLATEPTDPKDKELYFELMKTEMKAKGALSMTSTMIIKEELDQLKSPADANKPANAHEMWAHLKAKFETVRATLPHSQRALSVCSC